MQEQTTNPDKTFRHAHDNTHSHTHTNKHTATDQERCEKLALECHGPLTLVKSHVLEVQHEQAAAAATAEGTEHYRVLYVLHCPHTHLGSIDVLTYTYANIIIYYARTNERQDMRDVREPASQPLLRMLRLHSMAHHASFIGRSHWLGTHVPRRSAVVCWWARRHTITSRWNRRCVHTHAHA